MQRQLQEMLSADGLDSIEDEPVLEALCQKRLLQSSAAASRSSSADPSGSDGGSNSGSTGSSIALRSAAGEGNARGSKSTDSTSRHRAAGSGPSEQQSTSNEQFDRAGGRDQYFAMVLVVKVTDDGMRIRRMG